MPACRQMSLTGTPASACLRIETIWVSVKRDFFMEPPGWGKHARKFYLWGVCGSGKLTGPWRPGAGRSWRCDASGSGNERAFASGYPDGPAPGPCRVVPTGSSFFSDALLHPVDDQHLLGHRPLEPGVLGLEVLEPSGVGHVQATE